MPECPTYRFALLVEVPITDMSNLVGGLDDAIDGAVKALGSEFGEVKTDLLVSSEIIGREVWIEQGAPL